jgi:hypothetical protein
LYRCSDPKSANHRRDGGMNEPLGARRIDVEVGKSSLWMLGNYEKHSPSVEHLEV